MPTTPPSSPTATMLRPDRPLEAAEVDRFLSAAAVEVAVELLVMVPKPIDPAPAVVHWSGTEANVWVYTTAMYVGVVAPSRKTSIS